ncbi:hypothetical protein GCM10018962_17290 [Dactylosporangium matsuzakiense]|uniref:Uncharacterized protein n=1 Tax=Dactylosporangium matsuzakiense TaxID=53360 RepID=A0A9W6NJS8_9ACTN|nr:hypothetical protein GCM10017581_011210 [Dactylosporangium matsuzakiense]
MSDAELLTLAAAQVLLGLRMAAGTDLCYGYCASHSRFFWGCACIWSPHRPD